MFFSRFDTFCFVGLYATILMVKKSFPVDDCDRRTDRQTPADD